MQSASHITFNSPDTFVDTSEDAAVRLSDVLTTSEAAPFMERSDSRAALMTGLNLLLIAGAFALPALWLNPLTLILSLLLLGGRQLGMSVINHDCAHGVFFRTRWLNDFVGHWLAGGLINTSLYAYRTYHLKHHRFAGTEQDPDLGLASKYPATKASLQRKFTRDLTGQTGFKAVLAQAKTFTLKRNAPFIISHAILITSLWTAGIAWTYLLWWIAYVGVFQGIVRLRFMSEHGVAIDRLGLDARENTSTTLLTWWERLFIGPNYVNFHLEHHLSAAVPCYRLAGLHKLLNQRGFFDKHACISNSYREVFKKALKPDEPGMAAAG